MPNLTLGKVIKLLSEPSPVEDHDLIVFEESQGRKKLIKVVKANEEPQKKKSWLTRWFSPNSSYLVYAVNLDKYLDTRFTRRIDRFSAGETKYFDLVFDVKFRVVNSESLARRYVANPDKDPVTRLQDAIHEAIEETLNDNTVSWNMIRHKFSEVKKDVISEAVTRTRDLADYLGLQVNSINLSLRLPEIITQHEGELEKIEMDGEKESKKIDVETSLSDKKKRLGFAKAGDEILTAAVDAVKKSLDNIAEDTRTVDILIQSTRKLIELVNNPTGQILDVPNALSGADRPKISSHASGSMGRIRDNLNTTFDAVNQISCDAEQRRLLLSTLLHLIAELMMGDESDDEKVKTSGDKLKDIMIRV